MRSMPTEIKKNRPDDQMTSCFLKLYTPTRVCENIKRNWSAGQLVTLNSRHSMPGNGHTKKETRSRNSRARDTEGQRFAQGCAKKCTEKSRHLMPGKRRKKKPDRTAELPRKARAKMREKCTGKNTGLKPREPDEEKTGRRCT